MTLIVCLGLGAMAIAALTLAALKNMPRQGRLRDTEKITSTP